MFPLLAWLLAILPPKPLRFVPTEVVEECNQIRAACRGCGRSISLQALLPYRGWTVGSPARVDPPLPVEELWPAPLVAQGFGISRRRLRRLIEQAAFTEARYGRLFSATRTQRLLTAHEVAVLNAMLQERILRLPAKLARYFRSTAS